MKPNKKTNIKAAITAVGGYVPEDFISNKDLEKMVDTNDEWITARTGIKKRRILKEKGKGTSFLAINAAKDLLAKKKIDPETIDLVIVSTITPDFHVASTAPTVASAINAKNAYAYDLSAACSGFLYGMSTATSFIESGRYKKVLIQWNKLKSEEIKYLIPHQANKRIIDATAEKINLDKNKVLMNIENYGNTTAATIPLLMYDYEKNFSKGDKLILAAYGAGLTWGAAYLTWAYN